MKKIVNKKAFHDYQILETIEAGIVLTGSEVKSVKGGRIKLTGSFVKPIGNELFLVNATIPRYEFADNRDYDPKRSRKLLVHKKEIMRLQGKIKEKNLTIVPLSCYTTRNLIKLEIGLGRGRKKYMKREEKKRRDIERNVQRMIRGM